VRLDVGLGVFQMEFREISIKADSALGLLDLLGVASKFNLCAELGCGLSGCSPSAPMAQI